MIGLGQLGALRRRAIQLLFVSASGSAVSYVLTLVFARAMGARQFGLFSLVSGWVLFLAVTAKLGFDPVLLRFDSEYAREGRDDARNGLALAAPALASTVAALLGILLMAGHSVLGEAGGSAFAWGALTLPALVLLQVERVLLFARRRQLAASLVEQHIRYGLLAALALLWVLAGRSLSAASALALTFAATGVAAVAAATVASERTTTRARSYEVARWLRTGAPLVVVAVAQFALGRADVLVLGAMRPLRDVGVYAAAVALATPLELFIATANSIVGPEIAQLLAEGERRELQALLHGTTRTLLAIGVPIVLALALAGHHLLHLFGAAYGPGYAALVVLAVSFLASISTASVGYVLSLSGAEVPFSIAMTALGILTIGLYVAFIAAWGPTGAAIATLVSLFLRGAVLNVIAWRHVGVVALPFGGAA